MKKYILPALAVVIFLASCSSTKYPTDPNTYPYPDGRSYPRQGPYPKSNPNEPVVVDRQGRVITRDGRVIGNTRNLPPGQAKKIYGSKSAKVYAPGQRKKVYNDGYYGSRRDDDYKKYKGKKYKGKGKGKGR